MQNVISFLEKMGKDAQLRHASVKDIEIATFHAKLNPIITNAILSKDKNELESLLGSRNTCCMVNADLRFEN